MRASKLFGVGSSALTPEGKILLRAVLAPLRKTSIESATIRVYSDTYGVPAHNKALTRARAEAVEAEAQRFFPGARLRAIGMGQADPVASNETANGRWRNRRVVIGFVVRT